MKTNIITQERKPKIVELKDGETVFGRVEEITSTEVGAMQASLARVTLTGQDIVHWHKTTEEAYIIEAGKAEMFLDGEITEMYPGTRVIIKPGVLHAARPAESFPQVVFLCISGPAFNPRDVYNDPRGRSW